MRRPAAKTSLSERSLPGGKLDRDATRNAVDELFSLAKKYRSGAAYRELLRFVGRFRFYSPFNAMLVHLQMPGARFVAPASRWLHDWGRRIKADARPLLILQPMGPVMFVFDVSDTEPREGAAPLPPEVERPFEVLRGQIGKELEWTIENAKRDGVTVAGRRAGPESAGEIRPATRRDSLTVLVKERPERVYRLVPLRYEILLNSALSREARYATLVHELAHLYCGHLGTPDPKWWPDRSRLPLEMREFEAESVSYLICSRLGIDNPSDTYLSHYLKDHEETPPISLERVMAAAGLIEEMGRRRLKPREEERRGKEGRPDGRP